MQTEKERELARLKRQARKAKKQIAQIVSRLEVPAFHLGYVDGKMAGMLNLPYKPPDIIKADLHTEQHYWRGWSCGLETAIEEGYKPTVRLPKPPIPEES